ncbi:MAG: anaerobic ribonucleoside-triphosphate reductase activating protein, partial [Spirochaetaceae bacterium]|nr:anaerobic ribonucleoside-triphosphate reductase activating protein [Spirochaetaceae bacterium]
RCPYCHNPELVPGPPPDDFLPVEEILAFLERRSNVLGGVCITGGEPLLHQWLPQFAEQVRALGLKVKLDTNGLFPDRIAAVQADSIAMDIKTSPERYDQLGNSPGTVTAGIRESLAVIRATTPEYEFRTTVVEPIVTEEDVRAIVALLEPGERYILAAFRPGKTLDPAFANADAPSSALLARYAEIARERGLDVLVREHRIGS